MPAGGGAEGGLAWLLALQQRGEAALKTTLERRLSTDDGVAAWREFVWRTLPAEVAGRTTYLAYWVEDISNRGKYGLRGTSMLDGACLAVTLKDFYAMVQWPWPRTTSPTPSRRRPRGPRPWPRRAAWPARRRARAQSS